MRNVGWRAYPWGTVLGKTMGGGVGGRMGGGADSVSVRWGGLGGGTGGPGVGTLNGLRVVNRSSTRGKSAS